MKADQIILQQKSGISSLKKKQTAHFKFDSIKKTRQMIVKNVTKNFMVGPFEAQAIVTGDYDLRKFRGYMICELNILKPFQSKQKLTLMDSLLKIKYQTSILKLLQSFDFVPNSQLQRYFDIDIVFQLKLDPFQKDWTILGSLKSQKYKFNIFSKEFAINQIGFQVSGIKKQMKNKKLYLFLKFDEIILKLAHNFRTDYLFQASIERIPLGKIIANLAGDYEDSFSIISALAGFQLQQIKLKFKDTKNIQLQVKCILGTGTIKFTQGKFSLNLKNQTNFNFRDIHQALQFLDQLNLAGINIEAGNQDKSPGLKISGCIPILTIPCLAQLWKIIFSREANDKDGITFFLLIRSWANIQARIQIIKNLSITNGIQLASLELIIRASIPPEFGVSGTLKAKIGDRNCIFRMSCMIGVNVQLSAQLVGTWDEPFGLKKCYIKDLFLSIGYMTCGVKGKVGIGKMNAQVAVKYDNINVANNMVYFNLESFLFNQILSCFDIEIPNEIASIIKQIEIRKMECYMVPPGGVNFGSQFFKEGFLAKLDCKIFGTNAKFQLSYTKTSLKIYGQIDPIDIPNILTLRSCSNQKKGFLLDVDIGLSLSSHLKIDAYLSIANMLQAQVYAQADIQGIIFYAKVPIIIFGFSFFQATFRLKAGLLRRSDGFLIQASFSTDDKIFKQIQNGLKRFAQITTQQFQQAKKNIIHLQNDLKEKKKLFDIQNQKQRTKIQKSKQQYEKQMNRHQQQAKRVFEFTRKEAQRILEQEKQRAYKQMEKAKNDAWEAFNKQKNRAEGQLQKEKNRASKQLNDAKRAIQDHFNKQRNKLEGLKGTIKDFIDAPWYEFHKKAALPSLYVALGAAEASFAIAQNTATFGVNASKQIYRGILLQAELSYNTILFIAQHYCNTAISIANQVYNKSLTVAQAVSVQTLKSAQTALNGALQGAKILGQQAADAYINLVDIGFDIAKKGLDAANFALQGVKQSFEVAQAACKIAVNFLTDLLKGIRQILIINQIFFELDLQKQMITIRIDLKIIGRQLKCTIEITFEEIKKFLQMLVSKIWEVISGK